MKQLFRHTALALLVLLVGFSAGCGKKSPGATSDSEISGVLAALPTAAEVKAAVDQKNYEAAMAALLKVKATLTTEDQQIQFMALSHWFKGKLIDVASTDPKAAEALNALRAMSVGR